MKLAARRTGHALIAGRFVVRDFLGRPALDPESGIWAAENKRSHDAEWPDR